MKHIVCLTKSYNYDDLYLWYSYHKKLGYVIHIIDNDSDKDVSNAFYHFVITQHPEDTYERCFGWPNQWQLFNSILNTNKYNFNKGDLVAFIDDDEYLWYYLDYWKLVEQHLPQYKDKYYEPMETFVKNQMARQTDMGLPGCVLVPQTLMSSHDLWLGNRIEPYVKTHFYRRNDKTTQGKAIIQYDPDFTYDFFEKSGEEYGHVPSIYKEKPKEIKRLSIVNGKGISTTTFGEVDYNACIRLYHYHIKSENDWKKKIERGSAAVDHQWYASDVRANKYYGEYNTLDFTMLETIKLLEL